MWATSEWESKSVKSRCLNFSPDVFYWTSLMPNQGMVWKELSCKSADASLKIPFIYFSHARNGGYVSEVEAFVCGGADDYITKRLSQEPWMSRNFSAFFEGI